ncbi:hypothetical protein BBP40_008831 [Aspergillus hancockii]|nr:hypothetical protein BBP40_008831 [Aspergillus hancockii]
MPHSSLHHEPKFFSHLKDHLRWGSKKFEYANAVYYPSWRVYSGQIPSSLKLSVISHVFYGFLRPLEDGSICSLDKYVDTQIRVDGENGCLNAFKKLKGEHSHLKVLVSFGGTSGSSTFPVLAAEEGSRRTFASAARDLVDEYGFDGISVDWEHPSTQTQGDDYVQLLATLREYFPTPGYILTSTLPAGEWCLRNIDLVATSRSCDFINLKAYDFAGKWTEVSGHQAQLKSPPKSDDKLPEYSVESVIRYLKSHGVSLKKTLLGIPVYGRSFLGVTGPGQHFVGQGGENGMIEYRDLPRPGTHEIVDEQLGAAFCVGTDGGFVSYDNPETVEMKAKYVKSNKLGGFFYWTGSFDAEDSTRSLVETGYRCLNS